MLDPAKVEALGTTFFKVMLEQKMEKKCIDGHIS